MPTETAASPVAEKLPARSRGIRQSYIRAVTRWIEEIGGVNLGQGTCPLQPHPDVTSAAYEAMQQGKNSYAPFDGVPPLKEALVKRYAAYNGLRIGTGNVLVSAGATGAFESVCKALLEPGDEVVLLEPVYNYHLRQVEERGAVPRFVPLHAPDWRLDVAELEAAFTLKTKFLVFSNPHNPTGKVFRREELEAVGEACRRNGVVVVVDEVYEYILSEGHRHVSMASLPGMFEHTITLSAASKTLFVTGWRVGWAVGPADVMPALGVKSDETYVCAPTPLQHAVARMYARDDDFFDRVHDGFQRKAEKLVPALNAAGLKAKIPDGAYYILADYRELGYTSDVEAMRGLIESKRIGAIPANEFFVGGGDTGLLRVCYALPDSEIDRACELLSR
jgi:aminotransferase